MTDKLNHLSEEQVAELIRKYYSGHKSSELVKEFALDVLPNQIHRTFPPKVLTEKCVHCQGDIVEHYPSKTSYNSRWGKSEVAACLTCEHKYSGYCNCKGCQAYNHVMAAKKREQEELVRYEQKNRIADALAELRKEPINYEELSFNQKVYLGAVLRCFIDENYNLINPLGSLPIPLAATESYEEEVIHNITEDIDALIISAESAPNTILIEDVGISYYPKQVTWQLNVVKDDLPKVKLVDFIINSPSEASPEEKLILWTRIALEESLEYLLHKIELTMKYTFPVGEKTISVFRQLLNDYSTSQIYYIIDYAIKQALLYKAERGVPIKQAGNSVITSAQSLGERAKAKGWDLAKYSRRTELPISGLSRYYYEKVLGIADKGFYEKPQLELC